MSTTTKQLTSQDNNICNLCRRCEHPPRKHMPEGYCQVLQALRIVEYDPHTRPVRLTLSQLHCLVYVQKNVCTCYALEEREDIPYFVISCIVCVIAERASYTLGRAFIVLHKWGP